MALSEFDLIRRYFSEPAAMRDDVVLGIGDDCALLRLPPGHELAVTVDTLVSGVHFFPDVDPEALGHKALAVNLSDLAAMGAQPAWVTLALTLPAADSNWLAAFSRGFSVFAKRYGVQLIGGDTTRGPLSITVQAQGFLPSGSALTRSGAHPDDLICVTGSLGDAGLALSAKQGHRLLNTFDLRDVVQRLERPEPRVGMGLELRGLATAAIDISDGLLADLGHILQASGVGGRLNLSQLPLSPPVAAIVAETDGWSLPLAAGDDYELCFTLPAERLHEVEAISGRLALPVLVVGRIEADSGLRCEREDGTLWQPPAAGFDHFADA
ncbi:MAG: thiamine-phosphate kinase [gamma proteobacterium endosymbiont of Lamellibrachia anaximandri]|nr:thiamine-phosphate kinase [gamma proteobacterium endosymbiont of Lamellibrachia anaximandri]